MPLSCRSMCMVAASTSYEARAARYQQPQQCDTTLPHHEHRRLRSRPGQDQRKLRGSDMDAPTTQECPGTSDVLVTEVLPVAWCRARARICR
jgi:hypothetical protein